jgi:hypothetical protein
LIHLLNDVVTIKGIQHSRLLELVLKCQWKLLKQFNVWMERKDYNWDVSGMMNEFGSFIRIHPFHSFHSGDATALKTVKTIMHALVIHMGSETIQSHLNAMPDLRDSEAGAYIAKLIQRESGRKRTGGAGSNSSGASETANNLLGGRGLENYNPSSHANNNLSHAGKCSLKIPNPVRLVFLLGLQLSFDDWFSADFLMSLPDPENAPTSEAMAAVYMQRLKMIQNRGGIQVPSTVSKYGDASKPFSRFGDIDQS